MSAFNKIAGYHKEKEELLSLVEIFNHRSKYEQKGASLPRGIIFYGPPGTGKTLFAEVLAQECSMKRIVISLSDSETGNDIVRQIKKAFNKGAKSKEPTMIFFDELDKVVPNDSERYYTDRAKTILTQLLTLIDGMEKVHNIVFVATCNDYFDLPESLTRAGRFDKKICLGMPDFTSRIEILNMYMQMSCTRFEMPTDSIAKLTGGFSPASLKTLVNECILRSDENNFICEGLIREKIREINEEDIPTQRSEQSYIVDAVRNLGSFLVARTYSSSNYVLTVEEDKICNCFLDAVVSRATSDDDYDDYDDYDEDDDDEDDEERDAETEGLYTSAFSKNDYLLAITALMGGYVAQELIFNKTYDNLHGRMNSIENILFHMSECGMLGFGLYFYSYNQEKYSECRRVALEDAFLHLKTECYEKAKAVLEKNLPLLKKLIPILVAAKTIEKDVCEATIAELCANISV